MVFVDLAVLVKKEKKKQMTMFVQWLKCPDSHSGVLLNYCMLDPRA